MKKVLSLALALTVLLAITICPLSASAYSAVSSLIPKMDPAETRRETDYNYAWLDQLIVRDDATAVIAATVVPKPTDYPYSHTYTEFVDESKQYAALNTLDENTVASSYEEIMSLVYYTVVALGMTDEYAVMEQYLRDYGISVPDSPTSQDKMNVAVTYAALKFDAVYAIYGKEVSIPVGVSAEGASVIIFAAVSGIMLPSGVNTFPGLAVHTVKSYVTEFEQLPVSKNPDSSEVFYWAKVIVASSYDFDDDSVPEYEISQEAYDTVSDEDKEYVDYAYFATILNTAYDVNLDPEALKKAVKSNDDLAIQRLILETMLNGKNVRFSSAMSTQELFDLACLNGCFNLEEEFYADVYNYDITVAQNCEKIWFTPFAVADQLDGGTLDAVSMKLNGNPTGHNKTTSVALDSSKPQETITLAVDYNDGSRADQAVYTFNIIKDKNLNSGSSTSSDNNLVGMVESFAGSVNPNGNEKVDEILGGVIGYVENVAPEYSAPDLQSTLTTFGSQNQASVTGDAAGNTDGYEFNYLQELLDGKYSTDADGNIITTKGASFAGVEDEGANGGTIIERATTVVKENPEIVAAPTSIIALGALAGYLMTKKHRDSLSFSTESEEEETNEADETEAE